MNYLVMVFLNLVEISSKPYMSLDKAVFMASLACLDEDCQSLVIDLDTGEVLKDFSEIF